MDLPQPGSRVTFLFTDVEASTQLVQRFGTSGADALARHHNLITEVVEGHGGRVFERIGDAAYAVFRDGVDALLAADGIHSALQREDWGRLGRLRVRISLHSGEVEERDERFYGVTLHRSARLMGLARGGETLVSGETAHDVARRLPADLRLRDLGEQRLPGIAEPEHVFQLVHTVAAVAPGPDGAAGTASRVSEGALPVDDEAAQPIRVMLVDDHAVVRRGLRGFLELLRDIEVVGEAEDGRQAVALADRERPDVILMDLLMPNMDGLEAIATIKRTQPQIEIVAVTSFIEEEKVTTALEAGASGYLLKDSEAEEVANAIRAAYNGEVSLDPAVARLLAQRMRSRKEEEPVEPLTAREKEVLSQVAKGASNKEIAYELGITERTARTHVSNILGKLGLASRTQAALWAVEHKITD